MHEENKKGRTILVVEDYDDIRLMMRSALEKNGYQVIEATNGREAVEVALRDHPDLILMDIWLPMQSGITAMELIRKDAEMSKVPIVAVTAYGAVGLDRKAIEAGCVECLTKPLNLDQLKAVVNRLLPVAASE
jgi:two-component system cell cycle response regulator DivK